MTDTAIAYHEAGHAVAFALAHRRAWLPPGMPLRIGHAAVFERVPVRWIIEYADGTREDTTGGRGGVCCASHVYCREYVKEFPDWYWRDAVEWQLMIYLAGGVAEAIHLGERRQREIFRFLYANCRGIASDLEDAAPVLRDLRAVSGRRNWLQQPAVWTLRLLRWHWPAVETIAAVLIRDGYIDGAEIKRIVEIKP